VTGRARERLLAGFHAVAARLRYAPASVQVLYVEAARHDRRMQDLLARATAAQVRVVQADAQRLRALAGDVPHQGVVALCDERAPAATLDDLLDDVVPDLLLLLLDGVTDPRNLGACLRTADAAGVRAVIVPRDRSAALSPAAAKAAAGAEETVPLIAVTNLARAMEELKAAGVWIAGAAGDAEQTLFDIDLKRPMAWVLGAEGEGLRRLTRDKCDWLVRIPMSGQVESLNVAVATGVCLFETLRQRRHPSP
jgi:23S rRNA (guanosine2251-2'-O)-methyltransferase